jgi:hypothetical protein
VHGPGRVAHSGLRLLRRRVEVVAVVRRCDTGCDCRRLAGARTLEQATAGAALGVVLVDVGVRRHHTEHVDAGGDHVRLHHTRDGAASGERRDGRVVARQVRSTDGQRLRVHARIADLLGLVTGRNDREHAVCADVLDGRSQRVGAVRRSRRPLDGEREIDILDRARMRCDPVHAGQHLRQRGPATVVSDLHHDDARRRRDAHDRATALLTAARDQRGEERAVPVAVGELAAGPGRTALRETGDVDAVGDPAGRAVQSGGVGEAGVEERDVDVVAHTFLTCVAADRGRTEHP